MRYFFEITYDGSRYHGWQSQPNALSVQEEVERAWSTLYGAPTAITGSSRTDTGVHCVQQFFHLDSDRINHPANLLQRLNSILPKDIALCSIRPTTPDAHARYSAVQREYCYRIATRKDPFLYRYAYFFFRDTNLDLLNKAAEQLLGTQDFKAFSKVKTDVNHFICTLTEAQWRREGHLLLFTLKANRFLRGMVRAIVGSLLEVGAGQKTIDEFSEIIHSRDRKKAGMNVPAKGLYLMGVTYPTAIFAHRDTTSL